MGAPCQRVYKRNLSLHTSSYEPLHQYIWKYNDVRHFYIKFTAFRHCAASGDAILTTCWDVSNKTCYTVIAIWCSSHARAVTYWQMPSTRGRQKQKKSLQRVAVGMCSTDRFAQDLHLYFLGAMPFYTVVYLALRSAFGDLFQC